MVILENEIEFWQNCTRQQKWKALKVIKKLQADGFGARPWARYRTRKSACDFKGDAFTLVLNYLAILSKYEWMNEFWAFPNSAKKYCQNLHIQCTNQSISWIIQLIFKDILAGFTFNNRVLRLPAIVLLNVCPYTRRRPEFPGRNVVFNDCGKKKNSLVEFNWFNFSFY